MSSLNACFLCSSDTQIYREKDDEEASVVNPYMCFPLEMKNEEIIVDPLQEKDIYGSWNRGKGLKEDGMMKKAGVQLEYRTFIVLTRSLLSPSQTMSMTLDQVTYHLVAYYLPSDVRSGKLRTPSETQQLSSLQLSSEILYDASQLRHPPIVKIEDDGTIRYM
jgi:Gti1/Pac2 family transcription factor